MLLPLELKQAEGTRATAHLIWPAVSPDAVIGQQAAEASPASGPQRPSLAEPRSHPRPGLPPQPGHTSAQNLPNYTRSLLRIKLPLVVTLARKCEPVGRIVQLGPGSIIQFEKSCEQMLHLEVGGLSIATGEAVKVGDKFGLRVKSMVLPEERFAPVRKD